MNLRMLFVAMALIPGLLAQDPSMFRLGPDHLGLDPGPGRMPGALAWSFGTGGKIRSTPALAGGMAFFGSDDGRFRAVDLKAGREVWSHEAGAAIPCSPAIAEGLVLFQGRDNVMRALDLHTGKPVWAFAAGADLPPRPGDYVGWDFWVSSPCVQGDTVFFGSGSGQVHALDLTSGKLRWAFPTAQRVRATPAVKDGTVYAGSFDGRVYALDAATGLKKWQFDTGGGIQSSPAVWEGTVYVGSRSAAVFALDARTGALKWRAPHPNGSWILTSPAVAGGKVIVGSSDEQFVQALDARTGEEVWRVPVRYRVLGSPVVAGGLVYVGTEGAYAYVLDLETGLVAGGLFGAEGPVNASLALGTDRILVPSDDNALYAFSAEPAAPEAPADPGALQPFLGRYRLGRRMVTLALVHGRLAFVRDGFPAELCRLGPAGALRIHASGLSGTLGRNAQGEPRIVFRIGGGEVVAERSL